MSVTLDAWAKIFNGTSRMSDEFGVNKSVVAPSGSRCGVRAVGAWWRAQVAGIDGVQLRKHRPSLCTLQTHNPLPSWEKQAISRRPLGADAPRVARASSPARETNAYGGQCEWHVQTRHMLAGGGVHLQGRIMLQGCLLSPGCFCLISESKCKQSRALRAICLMSLRPTSVSLYLHISPVLAPISPLSLFTTQTFFPFSPKRLSLLRFVRAVHYAAGLFLTAPPLVCFHFKLLFHCPSVSIPVSIR